VQNDSRAAVDPTPSRISPASSKMRPGVSNEWH